MNHAQENMKMLQYIAMEILLKLVGYVTVDRGSCHHSMSAWETEDMIHDSIYFLVLLNCGRHRMTGGGGGYCHIWAI